ncbi:MAG: type II secretion system F family protein [Patescibacteria group bacterium]
MPIYNYLAKKMDGESQNGTIEAPTKEAAAEILKEKELFLISLDEKSTKSFSGRLNVILNRVKNKDVVFFARQLSVMLEANVPVVKALRIQVKQTSNSTFKTIVSNIASDVDGGAKLSQALGRYPNVFDKFFIHMARAGETTGRLDKSLVYMADQIEKDYALKNRVKGAMIYPAFIISVLFVMGFLMMIFVVPKFVSIFESGNIELPITTRTLIAVSGFMASYWWLIIILVIGIIISLYIINKNKIGHFYFDLIRVKTPVIGQIVWKTIMVRFSRSLSSLLISGVPVTKSLEITSDIVNNDVYKAIIMEAAQEVEVGSTISGTFAKSPYIPMIVTQMINIGEETGKLDKVLIKIADFYESETETAIKSLVSLIEPIILVVIGLAAGGVIVSILMPMYQLTESFS